MTPIDRLRAILESSFAPIGADETPEAMFQALEAELKHEFAALSGCGATEIAELESLSAEIGDRVEALPDDVHARHWEWLRVDRHMYKLVIGPDGKWGMPDIPLGVMSVPSELHPSFVGGLTRLRYALHRREHPSPCDCATLEALSIPGKPDSPTLVSTGARTDGYYDGEGFTCESCGAQWFEGICDGTQWGTFWERVKPTASRRP